VTSDTTLELLRKDFPAGTVTLGGNGGPSNSSMYTLLVAADAGPDPKPPIIINPGEPVVITPWDGDPPESVEVVSSPSHGQVLVNGDGTLTYKSDDSFTGTDVFSYKLKMSDGKIALGSETIIVTCEECSSDTILHLSWDPNPAADKVQSYQVYVGATASEATRKVADLSVADAGFDASAPSAKFNAAEAPIAGRAGQTVCFRVTASNQVGVSDYSEAVCPKL
nr:cadherin-like domain-containing protein [Gammaproteobacteria bacterium]